MSFSANSVLISECTVAGKPAGAWRAVHVPPGVHEPAPSVGERTLVFQFFYGSFVFYYVDYFLVFTVDMLAMQSTVIDLSLGCYVRCAPDLPGMPILEHHTS